MDETIVVAGLTSADEDDDDDDAPTLDCRCSTFDSTLCCCCCPISRDTYDEWDDVIDNGGRSSVFIPLTLLFRLLLLELA